MWHKPITALVAALVLTAPLAAALHAEEAGAGGPRIVFDEKVHQFGKLLRDQPHEHIFRFRNAGDADLFIRRVHACCGCKAELLGERTVRPGGIGLVRARFENRERVGFQELSIEVVSNDPREVDRGEFTSVLRMRGEVMNLYQLLPMTAYFPAFRRGSEQARDIVVLPKGVSSVKVLGVESSAPFLEVTHEPYTKGKLEGFKLRVAIAADVPLGRIVERVVITTDHPRQPRLVIPVLGVAHGDLIAFPERIALMPRPGEAAEVVVLVKRIAGEGPLEVYRVEAPPFVDEVEVTEVIPGSHVEVALHLHAGARPGSYSGRLRVLVNDPGQPLFVMPVSCIVMPQVRVEPSALLYDGEALASGGAGEATRLAAPITRTVRVVPPPGHELLGATMRSARSSKPWRVVMGADGTVEVTLTERLSPRDDAGKAWDDALVLTTTVEGEETVEVPVLLHQGER